MKIASAVNYAQIFDETVTPIQDITTSTSVPSGIPGAGNHDNPYRFTGRRKDFEEQSEFYYYRNRFYSPQTGRFISHDPMGDYYSASGMGNGLQYCGNNPINFIDPFGMDDLRPGGAMPSRDAGTKAAAEGLWSGIKWLWNKGIAEPIEQGYGYISDAYKEFTTPGGSKVWGTVLAVGGGVIAADAMTDFAAPVKGLVKGAVTKVFVRSAVREIGEAAIVKNVGTRAAAEEGGGNLFSTIFDWFGARKSNEDLIKEFKQKRIPIKRSTNPGEAAVNPNPNRVSGHEIVLGPNPKRVDIYEEVLQYEEMVARITKGKPLEGFNEVLEKCTTKPEYAQGYRKLKSDPFLSNDPRTVERWASEIWVKEYLLDHSKELGLGWADRAKLKKQLKSLRENGLKY